MSTITFTLSSERPYIEINQLLKAVGACDSGGAGKMRVAEGLVRVDGLIERRKTAKIRAGQSVSFGPLTITVYAPAPMPAIVAPLTEK